jgi:hypothetical protein
MSLYDPPASLTEPHFSHPPSALPGLKQVIRDLEARLAEGESKGSLEKEFFDQVESEIEMVRGGGFKTCTFPFLSELHVYRCDARCLSLNLTCTYTRSHASALYPQVVRFHGKKLSWCAAYLENLDTRAASFINTGHWEFPEQVNFAAAPLTIASSKRRPPFDRLSQLHP